MSRLILRREQIEALEKGCEQEMFTDIVAHLRATNTDGVKPLDDQELERRVRIGVARAREKGMVSQGVLTLYCSLMLEISPTFDSYPPIEAVLNEKERTPDDNMLVVSERIKPEQWVEAKQTADPRFWATG